ncbi:fimbrial biogenesis outer membrane usher protein [Citrobacter amalonaticus]|nr:fimbrial biogenesis outer membrane usher protein [Citrobacter amalonaticus]
MQGFVYPGKRTLLSLAIAMTVSLPVAAQATQEEVQFDPSFLSMGSDAPLDLERFARGGSATPGTFRTRIFLNDQIQTTENVTFRELADKSVEPCLTPALLAQLPLKLSENVMSAQCVDLKALIPQAQAFFDSSDQSLQLSVPQMYVDRMPRGAVPPSAWDSGVPAALLGYNFNAYNSDGYKTSYRSMYSSLNGGINLGGWYFRHTGNWTWNDDTGSDYQDINTYIQRDIPQIKGRILGGRTNTSGRLFDTLPFTGLMLESDDRMEPMSRRGYAPEIRGIARTNAKVTVRQNGAVLYETTVSPGEFVIDDLYPTGYGGDLDVVVREADGTEQNFKVPFSSVTQLLRPGQSRYELVGGELNVPSLRDDPMLVQGTWQYGLTNRFTVYGGVQGSEHYLAGQVGSGFATPVGAFSFDVTHARTELGNRSQDGSTLNGESYRLSYSKNITETQSNFSLAAYRFSTEHYMDYLTAMQTRDIMERGYDNNTIRRTKSRYTLTASQGLAGWGQLYISASIQNYWNASGTDKQYQLGYNNTWNRVTYGISGARSYDQIGKKQDTIMLTLSMPLGNQSGAPTGRLNYTNNSDGRNAWQAGVSGSAGRESQMSYGLTATTADSGRGNSMAANGQYRTPVTTLTGSLSAGKYYTTASAGLSGTLIGHGGGVTLSPYQGDTFALVEAKGAEGAKVSGHSGIYIDRFGFAVVPYLNPYQLNEVAIDLAGTADGVELENTAQKVAPKDLAIVKLSYSARRGRPLLITATQRGEPVPFGAEARDDKNNVVGYVGQGGQIYARVEEDRGTLSIRWGRNDDQQCRVPYSLSPVNEKARSTTLQEFRAVCGQ